MTIAQRPKTVQMPASEKILIPEKYKNLRPKILHILPSRFDLLHENRRTAEKAEIREEKKKERWSYEKLVAEEKKKREVAKLEAKKRALAKREKSIKVKKNSESSSEEDEGDWNAQDSRNNREVTKSGFIRQGLYKFTTQFCD